MGTCQAPNPTWLIDRPQLTLFHVVVLLRNPPKFYSNHAYSLCLSLSQHGISTQDTSHGIHHLIHPYHLIHGNKHYHQQVHHLIITSCFSSSSLVICSSHSTMHVLTLLDHHSNHTQMHDYINACSYSYSYSKTFMNPNYSTKQNKSKKNILLTEQKPKHVIPSIP